LGGSSAVSRDLGDITPSGVFRWSEAPPKGTGGLIPSRYIPRLIRIAHKRKLFLEPNMFFRGHLGKKR
jgi:hypothetical protein